MFTMNIGVGMKNILDGSSHTIAMGEAAGGDQWPVCAGVGCTTPAITPTDGSVRTATVGWISPEPSNSGFVAVGLVVSGTFGCTMERMNKKPVTDTMSSVENGYYDLLDCRSSENGGPHRTSNFRSDHKGGCMFLMGDVTVHTPIGHNSYCLDCVN